MAIHPKVKKFIDDLQKEAGVIDKKMMEMEEKAQEKISIAKSRLMKKEPFFAMLLFRMPFFPVWQVPTMGTDGTVCIYNPKFVCDLMRKDLLFVLLHEIEHVFFQHPFRSPVKFKNLNDMKKIFAKQGGKDVIMGAELDEMEAKLAKWNHAGDFVINYHILHETDVQITKQLKENILVDDKFRNKVTEQVYKELKDENKSGKGNSKNGANGGNSPPGIGDVLPTGFGGLSKEEVEKVAKEFGDAVKQAAIVARKAGKLPGHVSGIIEDLYTTSTPYQDVFRTIFSSVNKEDYTFRTPNRRYTMYQVEHGIFMPSLYGEDYAPVVFFVDTSGSVSERERQILTSDLRHILEDYNVKIYLYYVDTEVKNKKDPVILTREDIKEGRLQLKFQGYGGTDFRPAFNMIRNHEVPEDPDVIIYMTDLEPCSWDLGSEPEAFVYWARLPNGSKHKPPFGTIIDIVIDSNGKN